MAIYQYLTIYDDLDVPVDGAGTTTCSTNPAHARPYLIQVLETAESEVDFLEGRSTIGQVNIKVLDKRVTAGNQATGWLTAILASSSGENKLVGRRIKLDARDASAVLQYVIFDGVINEIGLDTDNVTYTIITRDVRDNERAQPLFNLTGGSTSIFPPGIRDGYGKYVRSGGGTALMVPAAPVMGGIYKTLAGITGGQIRLDHSAQSITPDMYHEQFEALNVSSARYDNNGVFLGYCYPNVIVRWRDEATHGAWHNFINMPVLGSTYKNVFETDSQIFEIDINSTGLLRLVASAYDLVRLFSDGSGSFTLPTNNQRVEVQVLSNLPPSELYPFWWDGNLGQLLKDIYDGVYSYTNPKIRYNAAGMTAFIAATPNARVRITKIVEDMRPWVEENIYKPMGYAPAINQDGEVVPVSLFLPDASITPITLDNTNCKSAEWKHTSSDSVTKTTWRWKSEGLTGPLYKGNWWKPPRPIVLDVQEIDREDVYLAASATYVGTKEVTYEPETFRDIDPPGAYDAAQTNSTGRQAQKVSRGLIDRFRFGGQHIMVKGAKRSDTGVAALKVGDWVICGFTNLPDYGTHVRGMSRLAQVIKIKDVDPLSRDMELVDSGPSGAPLSIPTIGIVTISGQIISVPVTAVASAEVAIEYALSVSQPASGSPLWQRAARGGTGTYVLPMLPVGVTVWIRARSEATSKRPSAWATAVSIGVGGIAYPYTAVVVVESGIAVAKWEANEQMLGARVYYAITSYGLTPPDPLVTFFDVDATLGTKDIGAVQSGDTVSILVEGWTGWTGSAVSGTQGRSAVSQLTVGLRPEAMSRPTIQSLSFDTTGHCVVVVQGDERTKSIKCAAVVGTDPTLVQIRATTSGAGRTVIFTFGPFAAGDVVHVGALAYSAIGGVGVESPAGFGQIAYVLPPGIITGITPFASNITPIRIVATLPGTGATNEIVFLTTDGKLYKWDGAAWIAVVGDFTGTIDTADIANGAVTSAKIGAAAVIAGKIAASAVGSAEIAALAVTTAKIAALAVTSAEIGSAAVTAGKIAANAVGSTEIAALAVTAGKVAASAISTTELAAAAVTAGKIALLAVDYTKVMDAAAGRAGNFFNEIWDHVAPWDFSVSGTAPTLIAGGSSGNNVARSSAYTWGIWPYKIPYNPLRMYRLRARYRCTTNVTSGVGLVYIGVISTDNAGVVTNANGGYDYLVDSGASINVATGWVERETWLKGANNPITNGSSGPSTDPRAPSSVGIGTTYLQPMASFNYNTGNGVFEFDYFVIEEMSDVPGGQIKALTVTAAEIAANTITAAKITALTITAAEIAANTITAAKIAADTITASEIAAGAITASELAANAVIAGKILAGTIVAADIAANTITGAKIAANTIAAGNIVADTITASEIAAGAITASELAAAAVTAGKIAALTIVAGDIAAATITGAKIAANTIAAANIVADTITAAEIAAGAITASELAANSVVAGKIAALTIVAGDIAANTITAAKIAAGTITATELAANSVIAGKIAAGAVSTTELAAGAVTAAKIAAGTITAAEISAGSITADRITANSIGFAQTQGRNRCYAFASSFTLTNNNFQKPALTGEVWDTNNIHSTVTNTSRFTIPTGGNSGIWIFTASCFFVDSANANGDRYIKIMKNGGPSYLDLVQVRACTTANDTCIQVTGWDDNPSVGDYYEVEIWQDSGVTVSCDINFKCAHLW